MRWRDTVVALPGVPIYASLAPGPQRPLCLSVPNIYPTRSRYEPVLVNEAAKDVGSS